MARTFYNVALVPEKELFEKAIEASRLFAPFGTKFVLGETAIIPHLSLYMVELESDALEAALSSLETIAKRTSAYQLTATKYNVYRGYIDVEYKKTAALSQLQFAVVDSLNSLRVLYDKNTDSIAGNTDLETQNELNYGYGLIGDLFRPHLTFTRLQSEEEIALQQLLGAVEQFSGTFLKLGLFKKGDSGTCVQKVYDTQLID